MAETLAAPAEAAKPETKLETSPNKTSPSSAR